MAVYAEIKVAVEVAKNAGALDIILLHHISGYPIPVEPSNIRTVQQLAEDFNVIVGLSDHTISNAVSVSSVVLGARVIRKHFTLDRNLPGPDHVASMVPDDFRDMVAQIRALEVALGDGEKRCMPSEVATRKIARKSIVASKEIKKGDAFSESNITIKRPEQGISPHSYWKLLGQISKRSYNKDEAIE